MLPDDLGRASLPEEKLTVHLPPPRATPAPDKSPESPHSFRRARFVARASKRRG